MSFHSNRLGFINLDSPDAVLAENTGPYQMLHSHQMRQSGGHSSLFEGFGTMGSSGSHQLYEGMIGDMCSEVIKKASRTNLTRYTMGSPLELKKGAGVQTNFPAWDVEVWWGTAPCIFVSINVNSVHLQAREETKSRSGRPKQMGVVDK